MKLFFALLLSISFSIYVHAQSSDQDTIAKATNFSVPSSAAFNLLEVNPSKINRPGFAKDFKFDWLFTGNQISPNIAIEAQPIWLLFAKNATYTDLRDMKWYGKAAYSLDISLGTAQKKTDQSSGSEQPNQSLAFAIKVNLYSAKNPLYNDDYIKNYTPKFSKEESHLEAERFKYTQILERKSINDTVRTNAEKNLTEIDAALDRIKEKEKKALNDYITKYEKDNWNSTIIDLGYGKLYNYSGDNLSNLSISEKGNTFWLSAVTGIGKSIMLNGMVKYTNSSIEPNFLYGGNIRYGGKNTNFFIEAVQTNYTNKASESIKENITTIAYGGDFKISNLFYVQLGLRTNYDKNFNLKSLTPLVNFNYLLNK